MKKKKGWYHNGADSTDHPVIIQSSRMPSITLGYFEGPFKTFEQAKTDMVNGYYSQVVMYRYALKLARSIKKEKSK